MAAMTILGKLLLAASLLISWTSSATHILHAEKPVYDRWARLLNKRWTTSHLPVLLALSVPFVATTALFCLGWWPVWTGAALLAMMVGLRQWEIAQWNYEVVVGLGKYVPAAAAVLGYVSAAALAGWLAPALDPDQVGWDAAAGILAGSWVLAAIAKYRESGMLWVSANNVALLVYERTYHGPGWLNRLRRAAARQPWICLAAANVGFWGEALGGLFIFPAMRWPLAIALTLFQLGILILLGYVELEWIFIMLAVAALSHGSPGLFG